MSNVQNPALGSIGIPAFFALPQLPSILVEWLALIPLVVHLTSALEDFKLIGEACLRGSITTPLFPKLGQLKGIAKLLIAQYHFVDQVAARSAGAATAWDVSWGSVFQCANASARELITEAALPQKVASIRIDVPFPPFLPPALNEQHSTTLAVEKQDSQDSISSTPSGTISPHLPKAKTNSSFRRYQNLTIIDLRRTPESNSRKCNGVLTRLSTLMLYVALCIVAALAALTNSFGTAAIIFLSCLTKTICRFVPVTRPAGYLRNNESYENGCMLAAGHENASSWTLYIGDRAIVDWLLNKPMLAIDSDVCVWLVRYFSAAHYLHLLIMTYVAGQKGIDGLLLLSLMLFSEGCKIVFRWDYPVQEWLRKESITCTSTVVEVSGRTPMLGAIQLLHGRVLNPLAASKHNSWMDSIIAPSPRVSAWHECLTRAAQGEDMNAFVESLTGLSDFDMHWIKQNAHLSIATFGAITPLLQKQIGTLAV